MSNVEELSEVKENKGSVQETTRNHMSNIGDIAEKPVEVSRTISVADKVFKNAQSATEKEHRMTLWQGIKLYPKAVGWSILISTCIAMEGYDISLVNNFYGFDTFNRKYGVLSSDGSYQIPARVCFLHDFI